MRRISVLGAKVRANAKLGRVRFLIAKAFPAFAKWRNWQTYHMRAVLKDKQGNIKQVVEYYNTVTTAGKNGIADQVLASPTLNKPTHMAVGTGTGGTTALTTENDRNALTTKTRSNAVVTMVGDWAAGDATAAITEAGVFDAASTGNMWLYASFSVINKGASDTLSISWTLTVS